MAVIKYLSPHCWEGSGALSNLHYLFGDLLSSISLVPYATFFVKTYEIAKESRFISIYFLLYIKILTFFVVGLQEAIGWERPYPMCVPNYISKYAVPDPNIVYLFSSNLSSIYMTYRGDEKGVLKYAINVFIYQTLYLILYKLSYLATTDQILISVVLSSTCMSFAIFIAHKINLYDAVFL